MNEQQIFEAALQHEPGRRAEYLDEACADDPKLRQRVEHLLRFHEDAGEFFEKPAAEIVATEQMTRVTEKAGDCIGPYKLLQQIGEGGMGVVYMAQQTEPIKRRVALKVIKPGMDTREIMARFEVERQALAMMDHPNIAKVFDAGTTETSRPYFVMELVKGIAITKYCDEQHLTPRERLELFLPVCQAVQHAHQKGVIHRDLKPSNVLVALYDSEPVPKVIDFGVAKAINQELTEKTLFTHFGQVVGTLEYMSPEQAQLNQLDIDTRSDIYSLGALLYELLTGTTPIDRQRLRSVALDEVVRIIREEDPPFPSTRLSTSASLATIAAHRRTAPQKLSTLVRGELDWVVMRALEKDRARRYQTASHLATDIQRHLSDEPVEACPPSFRYRLSKFSRRHRTAIATGLLMVAALALGLIGTTWQALHATKAGRVAQWERDRAKEERDRATAAEAFANAEKERALAAEEEARRLLYGSDMQVAWQAWELGNYKRVAELLERHRPKEAQSDRRGFEWHHLLYLQQHGGAVLDHPLTVWDLAFSPVSATLAVGTWRHGIYLWDVKTKEKTVLLGDLDKGSVLSLDFSPDGELLAAAHTGHLRQDRTSPPIYLLNIATGETHAVLRGHTSMMHDVAFSVDGRRLASTSIDRTIKLWDVPLSKEIATLDLQSTDARAIVFSPDVLVAGLHDGTIKLLDAETLEERSSMAAPEPIASLAVSPDGSILASGHTDGAVRLWNLVSGQQTAKLTKHTDAVKSLAFSPDGSLLSSAGSDCQVNLWNVEHSTLIRSLQGHRSFVFGVAFSSDGKTLASGGHDRTVRLWDMEVRARDRNVLSGHKGKVTSVAISSDDSLLASGGSDGLVKVWDLVTGKERLSLEHGANVHDIAFSPDGKQLVSVGQDETARLWNLETSRQQLTLRKAKLEQGWRSRDYWCVAFSRDGKSIVAGGTGAVTVWDATSGELTNTFDVRGWVNSLMFSPDSGSLAITSGTGVVTLDRQASQERLWFHAHEDATLCVAFSPDGQILASSSSDQSVKLWDALTGENRAILTERAGVVQSLAFSPDGRTLVTGGLDSAVRLWDISSLDERFTLRGHAGSVNDVAYSNDGRTIVSASADGTIRIWRTGETPE